MFITLEGIDGCGKSTQVQRLAQHLPNAITTREPGGSPNAESIRSLLVEGRHDRWDAVTEVLLFTAARRDHIKHVIQPALAAGMTVICDRYIDSTRVYQSQSTAIDLIEQLHCDVIALDPDITFWIDTPPEVTMARLIHRTDQQPDRFEKKGIEFQRQLSTNFGKLSERFPARIKRIDGTYDADNVFQQIVAYL